MMMVMMTMMMTMMMMMMMMELMMIIKMKIKMMITHLIQDYSVFRLLFLSMVSFGWGCHHIYLGHLSTISQVQI